MRDWAFALMRRLAMKPRLLKPGVFLGISILLLTIWLGSVMMLHVASLMVHLLLMLAIFFLVGHLLEATAAEDFWRL
jgi:type IV secretory pathway VirB3-like protein